MNILNDIRIKSIFLIILVVLTSNLYILYLNVSTSVSLQKTNLEKNSHLLAEAQALQAVGDYWHFDYESLEKSADGFEASPGFYRITFFDDRGKVLVDRRGNSDVDNPNTFKIRKNLSKEMDGKVIQLGHFIYEVSYKQLEEFKRDTLALAFKSHSFMVIFLSAVLFLVINMVIILPINRISNALSQIAQGKTDIDLPYLNSLGQIGMLAKAANFFKDQTDRLLSLEVKNRKEAEDANRLKDLFLARMSHELRTPLHGISGCAQILSKQESMGEEENRLLKTIQDLTANMTQLVSDILDFSKIKFDKIRLNNNMHDFQETVHSIKSVAAPLISENENEFVIKIPDNLPKYLEFDAVRFKQIIFNLLSNAGKFTQNGVVTFSIKELSRSDTDIELQIMVSDTGKGMSQDFLSRGILNSFTQEDESINREYGGTGLGLSIVNQIVKLMGAELEIESKPGRGSTFWVTGSFKYKEEADKPSEEINMQEEAVGLKELIRVLIADDDAVNRMILTKMLKTHGFSATCVENGEQALAYAKENNIDVILMDVMMPKMDGIEASKAIRNLELEIKNVPIIAVTADVKESTQKKCIKAGMDDYITKPFDAENIKNIIVKVLNRKRNKG